MELSQKKKKKKATNFLYRISYIRFQTNISILSHVLYLHIGVICLLFTYFKYCSHKSVYIVHSRLNSYYRNSLAHTLDTTVLIFHISFRKLLPGFTNDVSRCLLHKKIHITKEFNNIRNLLNFEKNKFMGCNNQEVISFSM